MSKANISDIQIQGIVRNLSKNEVVDGQSEDLINLRFKDGSWRTSGNGKAITISNLNTTYSQLYVHTCTDYRNLLGVYNGTLYWFANIAADNETFSAVTPAKALCQVTGDIYINQTGHLLTIIDEADDFEYFVFKTGDEEYVEVNVDANGEQNSRNLYPFGNIRFNCYNPDDTPNNTDSYSIDDFYEDSITSGKISTTIKSAHERMITTLAKAKERNHFTGYFLACAAIKLYDGSYIYASNPILIAPREQANAVGNLYYYNNSVQYKVANATDSAVLSITHGDNVAGEILLNSVDQSSIFNNKVDNSKIITRPIFSGGYGVFYYDVLSSSYDPNISNCKYLSQVCSSSLIISLDNTGFLSNNSDVFKSLCIFITKEVRPFFDGVEDYKKHHSYVSDESLLPDKYEYQDPRPASGYVGYLGYSIYRPQYKTSEEIKTELSNSPFYLLREYNINEINTLINNPIVDLSDVKYNNILNNITHQDTLTYESQSRLTYLPKAIQTYNGKLHIANYETTQFHGFPLDSYMLQNMSLKVQSGSSYEGLTNLVDNNNNYLQFTTNKIVYKDNPTVPSPSGSVERAIPPEFRTNKMPLAIIITELDVGESQTQKVCRYIETPYSGDITIYGLNSLLSFPDSRAKNIIIYLFVYKMSNDNYYYGIIRKDLSPHTYINMSDYFSGDLKPFDISSAQMSTYGFNTEFINNLIKERYVEEKFPNGLKVSKTNNPFYFPVEQSYQVGNGTILAMCSNAIAVGTGQTGAAPLYVFCTDGIYALYVDQSGELAYTNARVISRDVCNHAKSVTPIDAGVVFTTDRGLMCIAGDKVEEIGQILEGDVQNYTADNWAAPKNVGKNMLTKVAELPTDLVDAKNFLQFLKDGDGAIINYNHNERELMVSNPRKYKQGDTDIPTGKSVGDDVYSYTYVLDRNNNWSRRDYSADEYVNNYPTSYRYKNGIFYKVDTEANQLAGVSEAPNKFFYLSNVIKLDTLAYKQMHRFVVRGKFDSRDLQPAEATISLSPSDVNKIIYNSGSTDNILYVQKSGTYTLTTTTGSINKVVVVKKTGSPDEYTPTNNVIEFTIADWSNVSQIRLTKSASEGSMSRLVMPNADAPIGCYVFGSYDGKQFALLGANERKGMFTDIGCQVERTDVRFFRIALAGHITGDSRIDFVEFSAIGSNLNDKLR